MNQIVKLAVLVMLCILSVIVVKSFAIDQILSANEANRNVIVEIDYGNIRPPRTVEASFIKNRTVLEILQAVAKVETHPVGQYVFVVSIDGVEGKRGEMAWYYTVDGKSADKLAYLNVLDNANYIKWTYKKDTCSEKVDKQE